MFSLRVCLAGLAVVSLLCAPVSASASSNEGIARRGADLLSERDIVARGLLNPRSPRKDAASRIRLAKKRAARKAKRDNLTAAKNAASLEKRKAFTNIGAATSAFAGYLDTKCARNKNCVNAQNAAALPPNGIAVCDLTTRHCAISCSNNFILQSDGSCLEGAGSSCPTLTHGIYTIVNGVCTPQCSTNLGYALTTSSDGTTVRCTNIATSTTNCGTIGNKCASSYNGVGATECTNGMCGLRCPGGMFQFMTGTGAPYCA